MAGRAKGTIQQYLASIRRFEEFLGAEVGEADQKAIRHWVDHLQTQPIGPERLRCHYSALKFLYGRTLGQPEKVAFISMPRKDSPLPTVLSPAEVQRVLDGFLVAKYRVFFALIYATGLRKIQVVLGHGSIRSTTIYTQVSPSQIAAVRSPLEDLTM